jgi:precorrin-2 dehydrogenase/sirohydrochlorin ferrochelatase
VVGAGPIAQAKIESLLLAGARVKVVALSATPKVQQLAKGGAIDLLTRAFAPEDLQGAYLCISATGDPPVEAEISALCRSRGILFCSVDNPDASDFVFGAVRRRGPVTIVVSTSGESPAAAAAIADYLAAGLSEGLISFIEEVARLRAEAKAKGARTSLLAWKEVVNPASLERARTDPQGAIDSLRRWWESNGP